jgi:hypothetical protein
MPSYTRGRTRENLKFVKIHQGNLFYGFKPNSYANITGISASDITALGWVDAGGVPAGGIGILGANSPKPVRVRKVLLKRPNVSQQGSASTFCSYNSIVAAQAAGWQLTGTNRGVTVTNTDRTKTVGAKIEADGGIYLFSKNANDVTTYGETLGLILPANLSSAERLRAFRGAERPRPPYVKIIADATTGASFSSYCSYDKLDTALGAGFYLIRAEVLPPIPTLPTTP